MSARFYGSGLSVDGVLQFGYPYPPVTLAFAVVGHLLGDVRITHVAVVVLAAWLLSSAAPSPWWGRAAAALLLTQPTLLHVYENAWTDTFVLLALSVVVWVARRHPRLTPAALGAFLVSKQFAVLAGLAVVWRVIARDAPGSPARRAGRRSPQQRPSRCRWPSGIRATSS